ncbi:MAG: hypothetical protein N2691_05740 [Patescibacteria group bacterium]|nr:hypothetical protein [Patescibacteria group bacterium]
MIVTPSILTTTAEDVRSQISRLLPYFRHFQIDIADGIFVENTTVSLFDVLASFESEPLPPGVKIDFHLMVIDYEKHISAISQSPVSRYTDIVLVHFGVRPELHKLLQVYNNISTGIVLNPEDQVQDCAMSYPLDSLVGIQIMSVSPGCQGNPFLPYTLDKIDHLRTHNYRNKIYLDGGINRDTLPAICSKFYKPDVITPGSYLSKAHDISARVQELNGFVTHAE